jgi:hypothetical protein
MVSTIVKPGREAQVLRLAGRWQQAFFHENSALAADS